MGQSMLLGGGGRVRGFWGDHLIFRGEPSPFSRRQQGIKG